MFWDSPILIRLCTSSWALLKGIAAMASHSCWTSWAIVFANILALTTVASIARSFPAIAAACAALASWPPMIVVASPVAASAPAPSQTSASFISCPCCWGTIDPVIFAASASYVAAAAASISSSTFGQPGPVTVCEPYGLGSGCIAMTYKLTVLAVAVGPLIVSPIRADYCDSQPALR